MNDEMIGHVETQRMLGALPWAILAIVDVTMLAICYAQVVMGIDLEGHPTTDGALMALTFAVIVIPVIALAPLMMETRVTSTAVKVRFRPYPFERDVPLEDIRSVDVVEIRPFAQFGGYGIRYARGVRAYNPRNVSGVLIGSDGRDLLIGSDDPNALRCDILGMMRKMDSRV